MVFHGSRGASFAALDHGEDARRLNATANATRRMFDHEQHVKPASGGFVGARGRNGTVERRTMAVARGLDSAGSGC